MKVLMIHPFGIGDVIFSLAAAEALARRGHEISYLCNERTEDFLRGCPDIRRTHRFDRAQMREWLRSGRLDRVAAGYLGLRRALAAEHYDAALDFSMGREYAFLAWCSGIRRRIGWDYKHRGLWLTDRIPITGFDERSPRDSALDLARRLDSGVGFDPRYPDWIRSAGSEPAEHGWIVVAPGGGESWGADAHYKRWPKDYWVALVRLLSKETGLEVVVLGSASESALVDEVAEGGEHHSAAPVTAIAGAPLSEVLELLARARAFVGTDGGLLHLANLAGTPVVGIYGPVSEKGYGPLETAGPARVITHNVSCRPCYRQFRFTGCAYDKRCLTLIRPERVAADVRALL